MEFLRRFEEESKPNTRIWGIWENIKREIDSKSETSGVFFPEGPVLNFLTDRMRELLALADLGVLDDLPDEDLEILLLYLAGRLVRTMRGEEVSRGLRRVKIVVTEEGYRSFNEKVIKPLVESRVGGREAKLEEERSNWLNFLDGRANLIIATFNNNDLSEERKRKQITGFLNEVKEKVRDFQT